MAASPFSAEPDWDRAYRELVWANDAFRRAMALPQADRGAALLDAYKDANPANRFVLFAFVATLVADQPLPERGEC